MNCVVHGPAGRCSDCDPCGQEHPAKPGVICSRVKGHPSNCIDRTGWAWYMPGAELTPGDRRKQRIAFLEKKRLVTIEDLKVKLEAEDWHGVQDCASDLRDIDSELDGLRF